MINDSSSSARYRRREESKNILEYIHGGKEGSIFGAWDYLVSVSSVKQMEEFILGYKRGKFLEKLVGKFSNIQCKSETGIRKAVLTKYLNYMSRIKYTMLCKIQKHSFTEHECTSNLISYGKYIIALRTATVSNKAVDDFVKSLDIGEIHTIKGGVSRTVTALVTMVADLNLKTMKDKLLWFNGNVNHFVVEFPDDGAPESKEKTRTIGTFSLWNYGSRIRSREFQYPLHMLTASEKDDVCELLWKQHSDEMNLIEGNIFHITNEKVTFSFVPGGDTAWLCWAANVLPSSATYPSPFCNVHKSQLTEMDGLLDYHLNAKWRIPNIESQKSEIEKLETFKRTLSVDITDELKHKKCLAFMSENGLRQIGEPRIGLFADRIKPDPLHLEVNNWTHCLNILYFEATRRDRFSQVCSTLKATINDDG